MEPVRGQPGHIQELDVSRLPPRTSVPGHHHVGKLGWPSCVCREREQREREQRLEAFHEGKEKARLEREREQLDRQWQRLERERLERERLERERERVERERRREQERIQREREELRHQQEQLRYEQERRSVVRRPYDIGR